MVKGLFTRIYFNLLKRYDLERYRKEVYAHRNDFARKRLRSLGTDCRLESLDFGSEPYLVSIGDHVTIGEGVRIITHDGGVWVLRAEHPSIDVFGPVSIGNNCFIGAKAIIMPNVTIGDNCVIGAGSIVTKDIPANSVAAGVPARVISTLEEYKERSLQKALHVKDLSPSEKKKTIIEKFYSK